MLDDAHITDLLPAYVLGSLDPSDSARVEEHLLGCLICRAEAETLQRVTGQLAFGVPRAVPSDKLKQELMQRVQPAARTRDLPARAAARPWLERLLPVWGLASLGLIIALAAFTLALWQRLDHLEFLTAPGGMRAIPLTATDAAADATGFVLIGADGRNGALVVDGLPPPGEGLEYQLWLLREGVWTSGAIFSTDEQHYGGTRIRAPASLLDYSAVNITIEPEGGSPHPQGVVVLGGPLLVR